jgi:hypothetical protein
MITGMFKRIAAMMYVWNLFLMFFNGFYHLILAGAWLSIYLAIEYGITPSKKRAFRDTGPDVERIR